MEITLTDEQRTMFTNFNETVRRTGGFNGDTSAVLSAVVGVLLNLAADTRSETPQPQLDEAEAVPVDTTDAVEEVSADE